MTSAQENAPAKFAASRALPVVIAWLTPVAIALPFVLATADGSPDLPRSAMIVIGTIAATILSTLGAVGFLFAIFFFPPLWIRSRLNLNIIAAALGIALAVLGFVVCSITGLFALILHPVLAFGVSLLVLLIARRLGCVQSVPLAGSCPSCGYVFAPGTSTCAECGWGVNESLLTNER